MDWEMSHGGGTPQQLDHVIVGMVSDGISNFVSLLFSPSDEGVDVEFICSPESAEEIASLLQHAAMQARLGTPPSMN